MGRMKPGLPDRTAAALLNVALDAAVRATMQVKKDSQIPKLLIQDGSRGQNPALEESGETDLCIAGPGWIGAAAGMCESGESAAGAAGARQREMSVRLALGAGRWTNPAPDDDRELAAVTDGRRGGTGAGLRCAECDPTDDVQFLGAGGIFSAVRLAGLRLCGGNLDRHRTDFWAGAGVAGHAGAGSSGLKDAAQTATHRRRGWRERQSW